ncbi:hypothetical protein MTR_3g036310 [Medicago truncatula]|uniref:Uncharacterized protein n=1 Tax=Medicago truncatula TaxID=3880 RepID=G7IX98_MEDTR|nr:hypothetical protein MTR_3g036310 [Medicago truncatula]
MKLWTLAYSQEFCNTLFHTMLRILTRCIHRFPTCLFSCHTLTSLHIRVQNPKEFYMCTFFPNSLNLPSLINLYLWHISFCAADDGSVEPFSTLTSLKSLTIVDCEIMDEQNLCISSTKLVGLCIYMRRYAPETYFGIELSTPSLCTFDFHGIPIQKLHGIKSNLSSIKHTSLVLLNWLVELPNIQSLTVSSTSLQVLSLVPDLLTIELPFLCHLKSLKVEKRQISSIPDGMVKFLLRHAQSASVDIIY